MGAWSPSLDGDLDPVIGVEWDGVVLLFVPGVQMGHVFRGTQLGYIGSRIAISMRRYRLGYSLAP